jgi:uncharacterized protein (TIGR03435 family)
MTQTGEGATVTVGGGEGGPMKMNMGPQGMHMEAEKMPIDGLVEFLSKLADRPIVDQTGLKGKYKATLDVPLSDLMNMARAMGAAVPNAPAAGAAGPADAASDPTRGGSVFNNVKQLGLNLEAKKLPIEILIVDKCEKAPTEN